MAHTSPHRSQSPNIRPLHRRSLTLTVDPDGEVCPVLPLFRHPLYRHLRPICYGIMPLVLLGGFLIGVFRGAEMLGAILAAQGCLVFLAVVVGTLALSTWHGKIAGLRTAAGQVARGHRFLCPHCLRFGGFHYACGACRTELEEFVVHTGGVYLNDCPYCHARVFPRWYGAGHEPRAYCRRCGDSTEISAHKRRVRVLGVLQASDLDRLREAAGAGSGPPRARSCFLRDDGKRLTCVLDLSDPPHPERDYPFEYAGRAVEAIWLDPAGLGPLALGHAVDRYIRQTNLTAAQRQALVICVRRETLEPTLRSLLETRFGSVRYGIAAREFMGEEALSRAEALPKAADSTALAATDAEKVKPDQLPGRQAA
jgi:hypothetical protein